MVQVHTSKLWHPARFTHGSIYGSSAGPTGLDSIRQHAVIVLNNPLDNKDLLVHIFTEGMHYHQR